MLDVDVTAGLGAIDSSVQNPYCRHGDIHSFCPYSEEQEAFSESPAFELFFGGAAGPGKSIMLLNEGLKQIDKWGYRAVYFRRTYDELDQIVEMSHLTFPEHQGRFNKQEMKWSFYLRKKSAHHQVQRGRQESATYILRYCEKDKDKFRHQGRAYAYIAWDEITQYTNDAVYTYLFLRCRPLFQRQNIQCYIRAASNPGGPGHSWVKQRFIEGREPRQLYEEMVEDPVSGKRLSYLRQFIPATLDSNDILMENSNYEVALLAYPDPELRRAMRYGDWDIAAGVMFSEVREKYHKEPIREPLTWTSKEIVIDTGFGDFTHVLWIETTSGVDGPPRSWAYREFVINQTPFPLVAQMICERTPKGDGIEPGEKIERIVIDSDAWALGKDGGPSPADQMMSRFRKRGWAVIPATKGPGSRRRGWMLCHTYLYPNRRGGPLFKVMGNCPVFWRQLTSAARGIEPHDIEDLEPHQEDHGLDSWRYWAQARPKPATPTAAEMLAADPDIDYALDPRTYEARQLEYLRKLGFPAIRDQRPPKKGPVQIRRPY